MKVNGIEVATTVETKVVRRWSWRALQLAVASVVLASLPANAADVPDAPADRALVERAGKIVSNLELGDVDRVARVRGVVAQQYADLQRLQADAEAALAAAGGDQVAQELAKAQSLVRTRELHYAFLGRLAAELTPAQVDQVKDGMTYGVLPLTYRVYQDMVPTLTDEQKRQILGWLTEAREHAMDAGSSEEKHRWFGKYKGRINNYLAKAGIDLKQAEREMRERQKAAGKNP